MLLEGKKVIALFSDIYQFDTIQSIINNEKTPLFFERAKVQLYFRMSKNSFINLSYEE